MKKLILLTVLSFAAGALAAQQVMTVPSKIVEATVFFAGAELTHTASAPLARGENVLAVEGLSPTVDPASLKVKTSGGVVVAASEFTIDYLSTARAAGPGIKQLQDSIAFYQGQSDKADIDLGINADLLGYLRAGVEKNVSGSDNGLSVDELMQAMAQYRAKSEELQTRQGALTRQKAELEATLARLRAQLDQENAEGNKTSGVLKLTLAAPATGLANFEISYLTPSAGWTPFYDVNIASTEAPIAFALRSRVRQNTGLDWERVKLTLSTSAPSNGKTAPLFDAWFLLAEKVVIGYGGGLSSRAAKNSFSYDEDEELAEAVVANYDMAPQ